MYESLTSLKEVHFQLPKLNKRCRFINMSYTEKGLNPVRLKDFSVASNPEMNYGKLVEKFKKYKLIGPWS